MEIEEQRQAGPVADPVGAYIAVLRPIFASILASIAAEQLTAYKNRGEVQLLSLGRLRKIGSGDVGIAFELAVHDAVRSGNAQVIERVAEALVECRITQGDPKSILAAFEKQGSQQLIATERGLVTPESRILTGRQGQPAKLQKHFNVAAAAFRRPSTRLALPQSLRGLWKADLFLGSSVPDHWVGTTVKYNPQKLEAAPGLRVAIVPSQSGRSDAVTRDESRNLILCPVPHDASFMQVFHEAWRIAQVLFDNDFTQPKDVDLPSPLQREAARVFIERREHPVGDVLDATERFGQPELLETVSQIVSTEPAGSSSVAPGTSTVLAPVPLTQA